MFLNEKKALIHITEKLVKELDGSLVSVIAFGSRVRGDFTAFSDLDVLVVVKNRNTSIMDKVISIFLEGEEGSGIPFSVLVKSLDDYKKEKSYKTGLYRNLKEEGVIFYGET